MTIRQREKKIEKLKSENCIVYVELKYDLTYQGIIKMGSIGAQSNKRTTEWKREVEKSPSRATKKEKKKKLKLALNISTIPTYTHFQILKNNRSKRRETT